MKKNILLLETIAPEAMEILEKATDVALHFGFDSKTIKEITDQNEIHGIITRGIGKVNEELMTACPKLEVAARCGVGLDNLDVKTASEKNIKIVNTPGANANTVAEHTIALMLILQRNMYTAINDVKSGNWAARATFKSDELNEKTIGIMGLGNIGLKVANIAQVLGMKVIYWSQNPKDVPYERVSQAEIFERSDVISLHLSLNPETEGIISAENLAKCKPTAIIINTARGQLVNKEAMVQALHANKLGGYGADVPTTPPPTKDDELTSHPKAIITAHVSSLTANTYKNMSITTANNVLSILRNHAIDSKFIFNLKDLKL
ncbi:NAD(P)-dependent oxidoreductase [Lacihabitans lacunae]|uniref:NAD(P)-dependent oxidoreductase n=1 Tax=Lacihabitans lacunae TaxID=1028214 RepID=A0ABV7YWG5_9BACT